VQIGETVEIITISYEVSLVLQFEFHEVRQSHLLQLIFVSLNTHLLGILLDLAQNFIDIVVNASDFVAAAMFSYFFDD
jgi:hypothetical protein